MKLTVLMDNTTILDTPYLGESGLSFLIETEEGKIVFDTGFSPLFLSNARKMGIDMTTIDAVVISHGHNDHTNGLPTLGKLLNREGKRVPIILHPGCLQKKWWRNKDGELEEIGMPGDRKEMERYYDIKAIEELTKIADSLYFLGYIPRKYPAANEPIGLVVNKENKLVPDFVIDDSALVYDGKEGLVVINGCAHSGLINILSYVKEQFPKKPVAAVIGGFHMLAKEQEWLNGMAEELKKFEPKRIYPCHCTDEASRAYLRSRFSVGELGVGSILVFE